MLPKYYERSNTLPPCVIKAVPSCQNATAVVESEMAHMSVLKNLKVVGCPADVQLILPARQWRTTRRANFQKSDAISI
ncbi:hypothetical protein OUZ56_004052 [Daphnia magna]|uniref:Uncharacterized protein n=1 Tax=Daphnia magna TaxID=35525 RepID=A0ABQ9YNL6_9CRUS|nr:hypothetical protein OUZ56_004052 [Daphnia magna]